MDVRLIFFILYFVTPSLAFCYKKDVKNFNYFYKRRFYYSSLYFLSKLKKRQLKIKNLNKISFFLRKKTKGELINKNCQSINKSTFVEGLCLINKSRKYYESKKYDLGVSLMEDIMPTNSLWPYLLKEKAWFYYKLKNYNKVLGLLVTYKSPLLRDYQTPEVLYLRALTYFKMCLYEDSFYKIKEFLASYSFNIKNIDRKLENLKKNKNKSIKNIIEFKDFKGRIITSDYIKKNNDLVKEIKLIKRIKKFNKMFGLRKYLEREKNKNKNKLFKYAFKKIEKEKKDYEFFRRNILLLNSEIIKRKRNLLYENKKHNDFKKNKNIVRVKRKDREEFYSFKGAFWADELGHYHFDLKNNCQKINKRGQL